jgi:hypothetical protein
MGSAVNDVSRQLGGALGVAVIGSVVSSAYRANLRGSLPATLQPDVARSAEKSIGVASQAAKALPSNAAAALTHAANTAYVDAITRGFLISAIVMVAALVVAVTLLPRRMRTTQAEVDELDASMARPTPAFVALDGLAPESA